MPQNRKRHQTPGNALLTGFRSHTINSKGKRIKTARDAFAGLWLRLVDIWLFTLHLANIITLTFNHICDYNKLCAGVAELADAPHSKCGGKPCRFESGHRHLKGTGFCLSPFLVANYRQTKSAADLGSTFIPRSNWDGG